MAEDKTSSRWPWWKIILWVLILIPVGMIGIMMIVFHLNRIPEELLQPPPLNLPSISKTGKKTSSSAQTVQPDRPQWPDPAHPPKDFEEYVRFQLERNPTDTGAKLYLELEEQFNQIDFGLERVLFSPQKTWNPGDPLTDAQIQWLNDHRDFIDKLRRMIEAGGPPLPTREEILSVDASQIGFWRVPNYLFYHTCGKILAAEAQRRLQSGDPRGATEIIREIYPLANAICDQNFFGSLVGMRMQQAGNRSIRSWIERDPPPPEIALGLQAFLADKAIPVRDQLGMLEMQYHVSHLICVALLNEPLTKLMLEVTSRRLMKQLVDDNADFWGRSRKLMTEIVSEPQNTILSIADAINAKAHAAGLISQYDDCWNQALAAAMKPIKDAPKFGKMIWDIHPSSIFKFSNINNMNEYFTGAACAEAALNLNRAALGMIASGDGDATAAPTEPAGLDPESWLHDPWRDPFTEAPLRRVDEATDTLIYSLGPDFQDQGGMTAYDPTNGTTSAGDLVIRVPKK